MYAIPPFFTTLLFVKIVSLIRVGQIFHKNITPPFRAYDSVISDFRIWIVEDLR